MESALELQTLSLENFVLVIVIMLFVLGALKAWALWIAARNKQKAWFVALFFLNTLGVLELIYIFFIGKPKLDEPEIPRKAM